MTSWLVPLVTVAALGGTLWLFQRGGGGTAIASLEAANRVLERSLADLTAKYEEARKEIAELRGRTDVTLALAPLVGELANHEKAAESRHDRTLSVLELIAARLGPEGQDAS